MGNKIDKAQNRDISIGEAEDMARNYHLSYREVSAGDLSLLSGVFREIAERS